MNILTVVQNVGIAASAALAVYKLCAPIVKKINNAIDAEVEFRKNLHEALKWMEEEKKYRQKIFEMIEWYEKMKVYMDFNVVPKPKKIPNGEPHA